MVPSGGGTGRGDWKTDGQQRRCQGVHLPVPAAVRGTTEGDAMRSHFKTRSQPARYHPLFHNNNNNNNEKSARRRRKHCTLAVVRRNYKYHPVADPLPGGAGRPKFNQLQMVTTVTYRPSLVRIDARNFELSNKQTQPHAHRQERLQYPAPQLASAQCNNNNNNKL